ncbi:hypothetical protein [Dactylosporangium sp. CA-233914]|uniref:hypothetical protein n=1 Tax=Dactylosporangium sp. CA-233914 TaxID=3239934 RepID=UPI003D94D231
MATDVWGLLAEEQRPAWSFVPLDRVGPLAFGMTHEQVSVAVHGVLRVDFSAGCPGNEKWAVFSHAPSPGPSFSGPAVTTYYDASTRLAGIAVDALRGPQVFLDGMRLVGQTPSRLEDRFTEYLEALGRKGQYSQAADPCSASLGLVLRVQRAGDFVLSRPVMVATSWADRCWDTSESRIPQEEWRTYAA